MKNRNQDHRGDWQTPEYIIKYLEEEFGHIDFDPCPTWYPILNEWFGFDGLNISWGNVCFINPPYHGKTKDAFIAKAKAESEKGKTCIMLIPNSTGTKAFHKYIWNKQSHSCYPGVTLRFIEGRVRFKGYNTKGKWVENMPGQHDSMIVIFDGRSPEKKPTLNANWNKYWKPKETIP